MLDRSGEFFGRSQRKVTVPAGAIALIHFDILYCAARRALLSELYFRDDTRKCSRSLCVFFGGSREAAAQLGARWSSEQTLGFPVAIPRRLLLAVADLNLSLRHRRLQFFRTSSPSSLLVADPAPAPSLPLAFRGGSGGELALWGSVWDWLSAGAEALPSVTHDSDTIDGLVATVERGEAETARMGAAYQLAAVVRTGSEAAAAQALAGLVAVLQRAAITRDGSSGQHGQEEAALRAAQYGLAAAGARAAPQLLSLLEDATGKPPSN